MAPARGLSASAERPARQVLPPVAAVSVSAAVLRVFPAPPAFQSPGYLSRQPRFSSRKEDGLKCVRVTKTWIQPHRLNPVNAGLYE